MLGVGLSIFLRILKSAMASYLSELLLLSFHAGRHIAYISVLKRTVNYTGRTFTRFFFVIRIQ